MCDKRLDQLMGESHVIQDHYKVILRGSQEIRTKYNSQSFCRHMVVFFEVCNSVKGIRSVVSYKLEIFTCQDAQQFVAEGRSSLEGDFERYFECREDAHQDFHVLIIDVKD